MGDRMGDTGSAHRALPKTEAPYPEIINHVALGFDGRSKSTIINRKSKIINSSAFTLIELLVVISIIALLMAILTSTLARVRNQARAVACQANLRQWGLAVAAYTNDNENRLPGFWWEQWNGWESLLHRYLPDSNDVYLCPMARRYTRDTPDLWAGNTFRAGRGGTFRAWWFYFSPLGFRCGSYGHSNWVEDWSEPHRPHAIPQPEAEWRAYVAKHWQTCLVPGASQIPLVLDNSEDWISPRDTDNPPAYEEDQLLQKPGEYWQAWRDTIKFACIDRHGGGINMVFLDSSVRKVGLKELWTFKWHKGYNTANAWTKAGGVAPEDWPPWMRSFKDY